MHMLMSRIKPNTARMWDYVMGGTHNFAVDRAAVKLAQKVYPLYEQSMQGQRNFLQRAVTYMVQEKTLDKFIDFGSGLPTGGNIHETVQAINPEAKVIYSDKDPLTTTFGKEILCDTPNTCYIQCAVEEFYTLLNSPVIAEMCGDDRRVGFGFIGVFLYVLDEPLAEFFAELYEWADKGSHIAVTCARKKVKKVEGVEEASEKMKLRFYARSAQKTVELIGPWKLTEHGLVPGFYWGLPEDSPEINREVCELSFSFMAYK